VGTSGDRAWSAAGSLAWISAAANREIARALSLSEETVKSHASSILAKLGLADRTQAAIFALQHHVVPLDRPVSAAVVSTVLRSWTMILLAAQMGAASALIEAVINAVGSACGVSGVFSHSPSCHELWTTIRQRS
jgi:hypothetical protein